MSKNPVSPGLKPPAGAARAANNLFFTDEQLTDITTAGSSRVW
jgi:hypothetical protein